MIRLHPLPEANHLCPYCRTALLVLGWHIPGMRNLADLRCDGCGREFYGDLAAGQALYMPMLLEKATGAVHDPHGVEWFAGWLRDSFARRTSTPVRLAREVRTPVSRRPVLLNCLDTLYGHSLLKLLNAQFYLDRRPDVDLSVLVPSFLRWMVPDGVAEVWAADLPLRRGTEWNDWLAQEIRRLVEPFEAASLSVAHSHPHPDDYDIERFTRVAPFPLDEWEARLDRPSVTFIWREDRLWLGAHAAPSGLGERLRRLLAPRPHPAESQRRAVVEMADALRAELPDADLAVAGLGERGGLPSWLKDLRRTDIDADAEREWCERYAASHLVVGVHGSNMLLPSAHAGAVVELLGPERWGNYLQDLLLRSGDCREMFFRYRFLPETVTPATLARLINSVLTGWHKFQPLMSRRTAEPGMTTPASDAGSTHQGA